MRELAVNGGVLDEIWLCVNTLDQVGLSACATCVGVEWVAIGCSGAQWDHSTAWANAMWEVWGGRLITGGRLINVCVEVAWMHACHV
jgi:hypothetical protein